LMASFLMWPGRGKSLNEFKKASTEVKQQVRIKSLYVMTKTRGSS
jgi:hypothetical protein